MNILIGQSIDCHETLWQPIVEPFIHRPYQNIPSTDPIKTFHPLTHRTFHRPTLSKPSIDRPYQNIPSTGPIRTSHRPTHRTFHQPTLSEHSIDRPYQNIPSTDQSNPSSTDPTRTFRRACGDVTVVQVHDQVPQRTKVRSVVAALFGLTNARVVPACHYAW